MFGGRQKQEETKGLEKQLQSKQAMLDRYSQVLSEVISKQKESETGFEELKVNQCEIDTQLTNVIEAINYASDENSRQKKAQQEIRGQIEALSLELEKMQKDFEQNTQELTKKKEEIDTIANQNKSAAEAADFLSQMPKELLTKVSEIKGQVSEMETVGHRMEVVCLNAAIEAGKIGESGKEFVTAAEEVSTLSLEYQQMAQGLGGILELIDKKLLEAQEKGNEQNRLLKENHIHMEKTLKELSNTVNRMGALKVCSLTAHTEHFVKEAEEMEQGNTICSMQYGNAATAMEDAKGSLGRHRELVEHIKEEFEEVKEQIKEARLTD